MMEKVGLSDRDVSFRLKFVNLLPTLLVLGTVAAFVLAGAPGAEPSVGQLMQVAQKPNGWATISIACVSAFVLGLLLQPLELASIRLLEGYWSVRGPARRLTDLGLFVHHRRFANLEWVLTNARDVAEPLEVEDALQRIRLYPHQTRILPTTLGNRLRAMEESAGNQYGLDAVAMWPRLYFILPADALEKIAEHRNQLDISVRLSLSLGVGSIATTVLVLPYPAWWAVPVAFALMSWFAYKSAVSAATAYGVVVAAAVDVYRLKLLQALRIKMPKDTEEEREINIALTNHWKRVSDTPSKVTYAQPDSDLGLLNTQDPPSLVQDPQPGEDE